MLRGSETAYKGSYKERVEARAQAFLSDSGVIGSVHVDVVGPAGQPIDGFIGLSQLIHSGKATRRSPLVLAAQKYGIPSALLHGRHLVGPSPSLALLVYKVLQGRANVSVLDLFSGTGIVAKVASTAVPTAAVLAVESDPIKVSFIRSHVSTDRVSVVHGDALSFEINAHYDLIVADPFYEETLRFVDNHGQSLVRYGKEILLACGLVEDVAWTQIVQRRLQDVGLTPRRYSSFGHVVFRCSPSAARPRRPRH